LSHPLDRSYALGAGFLAVVMVAGLGLLWRLVLSRAARARRQPSALAPWPGTASDLLLFFILAICGATCLPAAAALVLRRSDWSTGPREVAALAAFQLGLLAGIAAYHFGFGRRPLAPGGSPGQGWRGDGWSGVATVLIAFPLVQGVGLVWQALLGWCGLPVETPDNIQAFIDLPTPLLRALFAILAIAVAPVGEELVFRAGLFRYFRGRFPRWLALFLPAFVFGAMHLTRAPLESLSSLGPLVMLGIVLSLAYERTGRIGTAIVAHALFNLIMVGLVLLGVNT
jgi:membrane protease YdiL (CAAX protease family)